MAGSAAGWAAPGSADLSRASSVPWGPWLRGGKTHEMRSADRWRGESGEVSLLGGGMVILAALAEVVVFVAAKEGGMRGVGVALAVMGALVLAYRLWDRWSVARMPPPDPAVVAELNRPWRAAEVAAGLADYVADMLDKAAAMLDDDRRHLADLERRLRRWAGGTPARYEVHYVPGAYFPDPMCCEVAELDAEQLLGRGGRPLAEWSAPPPGDAAALEWFLANFSRVLDADEAARREEQERADAGRGSGRRRRRPSSVV